MTLDMMNKVKLNMPFLGIIALLSFFISLNIPIMQTLWRHSFDDGTYSHAYLIPFITFYLYYQLQSEGQLVFRTNFSWLGSILLLASCYGLFVAASAQISIGYWLASLATMTSAIVMLFQYRWRMVFPAIYLILIIPMWGPLATILQAISVQAVNVMMGFTGIPTYVEGNYVSIPAGTFEIAGGCSGLRYFIVSIAISSLFVFLNIKNTRNIILFFTVAIIGALVTNWIRITLLIIIGHQTDMTSSLMVDHNNFGWYIFIPFMIMLFFIGNRFAENVSANTVKPIEADIPTANATTALLITACLLMSSTTISNNLITDQHFITQSLEKFNEQQELKPFVQYYTSIEHATLTIESTEVPLKTYNFSGYDLDAKPTFYNNKPVPDSWKINNSYQHSMWNIIETEQNSRRSLVASSLQLGNLLFGSRSDFKIARIEAGLVGMKKTKLHWLSVPCKTDCVNEKENLELALNTYKIVN